MTTLADLTLEERDECEGAWAEIAGCALGIIAQVNDRTAYMIIPSHRREETYSLVDLTLRPDLPRAWQADGTPPAGEWQTAKTKITLNDNTKYDPERNILTGDAVADPDHEPRSSHDIRRFVGEWEEA